MNYFFNHHNLFYRFCAVVLIILHLVAFGPLRDAFAFASSSASYKMSSGALNEGGKDRASASAKIWQDTIGEPSIGQATSANYALNSGFIPTLQSNPPTQTQIIPNQNWHKNESKPNAFDLDDYFSSPDGYALSFRPAGNSNISVAIDPETHMVSFSQAQGWSGVEKITFLVSDSEGNSLISNKVVLQVEDPQGPDKPAILETHLAPSPVREGDLVTLTVKAQDLDGDNLTFAYSDFFTEVRSWEEGGFWFSEATWQTGADDRGHYNFWVTVTDSTGLTDREEVSVNVGNLNHPPVLEAIPDISVDEGALAVITPEVTDADRDPITYYFDSPFDSQGRWVPGFAAARSEAYLIRVTASDGIETLSQIAGVVVRNINQSPQVSLSINKYTVEPNEEFSISISPDDPDKNDPHYPQPSLSFEIRKGSELIDSGNISPGTTHNKTTSFSEEGYYRISAKVTDSGGLEANAVKDIQVTVRKASQPVMGDFNGDGLTDLGMHDSTNGNWEVCLSQAGTFESAGLWLRTFGESRDWLPTGGDFNGDAKTDIAIYNNSTGELRVAFSNGTGFTSQGTWLTVPFASISWQILTGNFNGDKYSDIAFYNRETGEVKVALGTGTGFGAFSSWLTGFGTDYIALTGDFNADSLTDLCLFKKSTGEFKVAFSNTLSFVDGSSWLTGFSTDKDPIISDFNNDGLADIGYWDKTSYGWYYAISTGASFINKGIWINSFGGIDDDSSSTGDFDGNGITDAATFDAEGLGITRWMAQLSTNKPADLLTEIDNGIGGETQITYTYSSDFSGNEALPFPVYVAKSISLVNNKPASWSATYTQNFNYSGGYFDAVEREFRGFSKVTVTDPITSNYTETYFYQGKPGQDGALKGQIEKIIAYDASKHKISQAQNTYEVKRAGPSERFLGFPSLKRQVATVWEEYGTSPLSTASTFTYDNIGNVTEELSEGDTTKTGDEKYASTTYASAYQHNTTQGSGFNRPLEALLKDKDANIVSRKTFEYDNKGNLNEDTIFIFNPITQERNNAITQYSYDSFGNLTSTTNALGNVVTTEYETTYYTYPLTVTNSLGQSISYVYEPKFGVVKSVTDTNGNTSTTTYDTFGRPVTVKNAYNQTTATYTYPDFNTKTTTNALGLFKAEYIDGLGRKYKTVSSGEDGTEPRLVSSETYFNNRGLTEKESLAHYEDEEENQISYIKYEYDIRGRVVKTISDFPGTLKDAESSISYISPLYTETTDPQGHKKGTKKDIYGNIIEVNEFIAGQKGDNSTTTYKYDIQNNLIEVKDRKNNTTQLFYDSLGRKLKMIDPDMGIWFYEYDLLGNLIKQTDAKGQVIEFEYDALNRLTKKTRDDGRGTKDDVTYLYDDAVKENCIGRLSKVTDPSGSTEFFYDKLGREIKSIKTIQAKDLVPQGPGPELYTVERTYDILDRLTTLKYPDAEVVNYSYDANSGLLERLFTKDDGGKAKDDYVKDITYNAKGQIKVIQYGNSTSTTYTYGQDLRLSRILTSDEGRGTNLQDLNYLFDKNGNLTTLTDNLRSNIRTYSYDGLDRLTQASNLPAAGGGYTNYTYQYDSIGNMTYKSDLGVMAYGAGAGPHALTRAGGYIYTYDANGNMAQGKNKTLSYDIENRLTQVNELGTITSFTYDGDGGRVRKTTDDGRGTTASVTYVGSLFEIDSSGKTTKHIFAGANRACSVTKDDGRGTKDVSYYHSDHLGSSSVITDESGNQVEHYEYTPYGTTAVSEILPHPSSLIPRNAVHHKFTGKELDSTGLYFYGARYYDPEVGRFITADPTIQHPYDPQDLNRYAYCRNNPINYIDPTGYGFWAVLIWTIIIIAAGWAADKYLNAEVNVGGGVSVPFDTGPSSRSSYSSSNPAPSAPQASNAGTSSSASSSDSSTGINQNLPNTSELITQNTQNTNDSMSSSLNRSYGIIDDAGTTSSSLDSISSPWVQIPISAATKAGSTYFGLWKDTIKEYAPGWTKGITRAQGFQSGFQIAGVVQSSLFYPGLYQKAAAQNLSQPQIAASSLMHGVGFGVGLLATEGGKWAGRAGGTALFAKFGIGGATVGGVVGAVIGGVLAGIAISFMEKKLNESMGVR